MKVKLLDKMTNKRITISSIYLEPNGSATTLESSLDSEIIMGDFNDSKEIFGLIQIDKIYQYKGNIIKVNILAYVDDIAIQGKSTNIVQESFNFIQEEFY